LVNCLTVPDCVIGGVPVEISAMACLTPRLRRHGNPHVNMVGPSEHLQVHETWEIRVDDFFVHMALGRIHELTLAIVADFPQA